MSTFISLLSEHHDAFMAAYQNQLSNDMVQAVNAMRRCQTEAMGTSQWYCEHCEYNDSVPLSCGHRSCPQCQHRSTVAWLERQQSKQLPVEHFMVTFTLPVELRLLAQHHPRALYSQMFSVTASVLKDFAAHKHGGRSGFTMVLHTHSRRRELHPHLHVVIPAGYYHSTRKQWHKGSKSYLYNAFGLAKVWRARMLEALQQHPQLSIPQRVAEKWVVDCRHIGRGPTIMKYLSRYLYRGVLPDKDIVRIEQDNVIFRYRDNQTGQWQLRTLPPLKFLWLIVQHVLPKGFQRVRDYGLLHGSARLLRLQLLVLLLPSMKYRLQPRQAAISTHAVRHCPHCRELMLCCGVSTRTK